MDDVFYQLHINTMVRLSEATERLAEAQEVANGLTLVAMGLVNMKDIPGQAFVSQIMQLALDRLKAAQLRKAMTSDDAGRT